MKDQSGAMPSFYKVCDAFVVIVADDDTTFKNQKYNKIKIILIKISKKIIKIIIMNKIIIINIIIFINKILNMIEAKY